MVLDKRDKDFDQAILDYSRGDFSFAVFLQISVGFSSAEMLLEAYLTNRLKLIVILQEESEILICDIHLGVGT